MTHPSPLWETLFWLILALLFLNYVGLYVILRLAAAFVKPTPNPLQTDQLPALSVFVPAFNEESVIGQRVENLLAQDYPRDRFEIVVGSDCSTDRTSDVVRSCASPGVRLVEFSERKGKLGMIDETVPRLSGEIVVITDANVRMEADALRRIAEQFADPRVGAACGNLELSPPPQGVNYAREIRYQLAEISLKRAMGKLGMVIGVLGGFYGFRRALFRPIGQPPCNDDLLIPMAVMAQGYRVVFAENARATEPASSSGGEAFRRRVRLMPYNLNAISRLAKLAVQAGFLPALLTFTYKHLRWLTPYLLLVFIIATLALAGSSPIYTIVAFGLAGVILIGMVGWVLDAAGIQAPVAGTAYQFIMMNAAAYVGLVRWLKGVKSYWNPVR